MKLKKKYIDLAVNQTETLCRIPSPSGFTLKATEYLIYELKEIGFQPEYSRKKSVIVDLGGLCLNRTDSGLVGLSWA